MGEFRYLHYDVFTDKRFTGNQLAVFPDARGLSDSQMQQIAAEMAFSETTFVLPSDDPACDVRMRIFTPAMELPMAGHPTVGTTFALAHEGVITPERERFVFELGVGPTAVDLEWQGTRLTFAWMTQRVPEFGETFESAGEREAIAAAVGLDAGDLVDGVPIQVVSSGVPFVYVPVQAREGVDRAASDVAAMRELAASHELDHYYVFTTEAGDDAATSYSRMFAPVLGITEDPATGGASGPLGGYLVRYGLVAADEAGAMQNLQGVAMGRPSRIHIEVTGTADAIERVRVGGHSVLVAEGVLQA